MLEEEGFPVLKKKLEQLLWTVEREDMVVEFEMVGLKILMSWTSAFN